MQSLILVETLANGSKHTQPLSQLAKITVKTGSSYTVIDTATGKAPVGLKLQREGDALKVVVDQETVASLQDFYREDITAEFASDGVMAVSADTLISGTPDEMIGASSGDGGGSSFLTVAGSIGLAAVIGGGSFVAFNDYKDNDNGSDVLPTRQTGLVNESIVVFDLITGDSSSHSGRIFNADTAYTIVIVIDSVGEQLLQPVMWSGAQNLGSDDSIILVGSGEAILGHSGNIISDINFNKFTPGTVSWATGTVGTKQLAAFIFPSGEFRNQSFDMVDLWEGSVPEAMSNLYAFGWDNSLPNSIRSSQGLA